MELFGLGAPELLLIVFVLLLLFFGKDKLPDLARSIGRSMHELKSGFTDGISVSKEDDKKGVSTTTKKS